MRPTSMSSRYIQSLCDQRTLAKVTIHVRQDFEPFPCKLLPYDAGTPKNIIKINPIFLEGYFWPPYGAFARMPRKHHRRPGMSNVLAEDLRTFETPVTKTYHTNSLSGPLPDRAWLRCAASCHYQSRATLLAQHAPQVTATRDHGELSKSPRGVQYHPSRLGFDLLIWS